MRRVRVADVLQVRAHGGHGQQVVILDNETECLKRLADELRREGADVTLVDEGKSAQRLSIRKSNLSTKTQGGTLVQATVSGVGSVTVERVWLCDSADRMDKLKAILALVD